MYIYIYIYIYIHTYIYLGGGPRGFGRAASARAPALGPLSPCYTGLEPKLRLNIIMTVIIITVIT